MTDPAITVDDLLRAAAAGHPPTLEQIDAVAIPPTWSTNTFRRDLLHAASRAADLKGGGANLNARQYAKAFSARYTAAWGDDGPPEPLEAPLPTDPSALADLIRRS